MSKVTVIVDQFDKYVEAVEEYTDFNEVVDKYSNRSSYSTEYKFSTGEEGLTAIMDFDKTKCITPRIHWETVMLIDKIVKPVIHGGLRLDSYFTWNNNLFMRIMGYYMFVGEMK